MATKKTTKKKSGVKSLFDHVKQVKEVQNSDYWDTLTESDKKTWTNYMILQVLSMDADLLDIIDYVQRYQGTLSPECMYKLLIDLIPKSRKFHKYVTGKKEQKYDDDLIEIMKCEFEFCSNSELTEYLNILKNVNCSEIKDICEKYGKTEKEIKKLMKGVK
jgi:hypothetical protein